jgi:hypothetical protein
MPGWSVKRGAEGSGQIEPSRPYVIQGYRKDGTSIRLRFIKTPASRYNRPHVSMKDLVIKVTGERRLRLKALKLSGDATREIQAHEVHVSGYPGYFTYDWRRSGPKQTYLRILRFATPDAMYSTMLNVKGDNISPTTRDIAGKAWSRVVQAWNVTDG